MPGGRARTYAWNERRLRAYPALRVGDGALVLLVGPPSSGKTTMAVRALDSVPAPVALWASEMGIGPSVAALFSRCGVRRPNFSVLGRSSLDAVHAQMQRTGSVALGIDSVQSAEIAPEDARHLLAVTPQLRLVVAISQINKAGESYGPMKWPHEADVIIRIEDMRWHLEKSRYQPLDSAYGQVIDDGGENEPVH